MLNLAKEYISAAATGRNYSWKECLFTCRMHREVGVSKILVGRDTSLFVTLCNIISLELQRCLCYEGQLCYLSIYATEVEL